MRYFVVFKSTTTWEQRKLGEIANRITRKNTNLESSLPLTISAQYGLIDQNEFFDKRIASKDVSGYFLLKNGEFAYNKSYSNDAPWGAVKRLDRYENGVLSTLYIVFELSEKNKTDSDFIVSYYDTDRWYKEVQAIAAEGARNHGLLNISPNDFFETILTIPKSIEEQKAIGSYFRNLDNLITLHQRKYSLLFIRTFEILKEACFFLNVNAWEQREFNSVFTMLQNNTLSRAELAADNGAAMNVHYGDILVKFSEVLDLEIEALPYIESEQVVSKFKSSYLQNGDVIVADTAEDEAVGKCTEIANLSDVTVISGLHTIPLRPQQKFASGYLGYYLNSNSYHDTLIPLMQGTKVTSISKSALQGTSICYPTSYDEQQQIGSYFRNLDNLITLHQRKPFQRKNGGKNYVRRC